jgi:hypothetical protein
MIKTCALVLALVPVALFAQDPPAKPPAQPPAQPPAPAAPKLGFTTPAGMLLIQIRPDQTATFEEMLTKLRAGVAKSDNAALKSQMSSWKVYKAAEPMGPDKNALYVVLTDPATAGGEYEFFMILQKVMSADELRAPETQEVFKKYSGAFAAPYNKLSLTPVGGQ